MTKPSDKWANVRSVATHMAAFEITIACLLDQLAKKHPSTARAIARDIRSHADAISSKEFPGVGDRARQYAEMIETTLQGNPQ